MFLTADQVHACTVHLYYEGYSDGATERGEHLEEVNWEGITHALNTLGDSRIKRTCTMRADTDHLSEELYHCNGLRCSNCGELVWDVNQLNYCPSCGNRVLEAV